MREREQKRRNSCSNSAKGEGEGKKICCSCCSYTQKKIIAVILKLVRKRNTHKHLFPCRSQDISFTFFYRNSSHKILLCALTPHTAQRIEQHFFRTDTERVSTKESEQKIDGGAVEKHERILERMKVKGEEEKIPTLIPLSSLSSPQLQKNIFCSVILLRTSSQQ